MNSKQSSQYRLRLAGGYFEEAKQDSQLSRWRSCLDNSQRVIENAAKAIIAIVEPVEKTHNPSTQLKRLIQDRRYTPKIVSIIQENLEFYQALGPKEHLLSGYGDDVNMELPWEIITENDARYALDNAKKCFDVSMKVYKEFFMEDFTK